MENNTYIGKVRHHFDELQSTNDYARQLLAKGNPTNGTAVLADIQSAGRGQYGREWLTEPNTALTVSYILHPKYLPTHKLFILGQMTALAVHDTITRWIDPNLVRIKWPNDVYVLEKKVAGILIENSISTDATIAYSIIGIGINVAQKTFPKQLAHATSLTLHSEAELTVQSVFEALCSSLQTWYDALTSRKYNQIHQSYEALQYGLGQTFTFYDTLNTDSDFTATITGIDTQNNLVLTHPNGHESSWVHGSVRIRT